MAHLTLQLITSRNSSKQRSHFAIFLPSAPDPNLGTLIQVIGAPMAGYMLEIKRNYSPTETPERYKMYPLGEISEGNIDRLEREAEQLPPPRINENFRAPVNDTTNRRCQEWTMDYMRRLVSKGIISETAVDIVQSKRDPPSHGII